MLHRVPSASGSATTSHAAFPAQPAPAPAEAKTACSLQQLHSLGMPAPVCATHSDRPPPSPPRLVAFDHLGHPKPLALHSRSESRESVGALRAGGTTPCAFKSCASSCGWRGFHRSGSWRDCEWSAAPVPGREFRRSARREPRRAVPTGSAPRCARRIARSSHQHRRNQPNQLHCLHLSAVFPFARIISFAAAQLAAVEPARRAPRLARARREPAPPVPQRSALNGRLAGSCACLAVHLLLHHRAVAPCS